MFSFFKKNLTFYLFLLLFFLASCGTKKLVLQKHGVSYTDKDTQVVSYQDLRKLYDAKDFKTLYEILEPVPQMETEDYFIDLLFIQSACYLNQKSFLESAYKKSSKRYFYLGTLAYEEGRYDDAAAYLKLLKSKDPVVDYLIGSSLLFLGKRVESFGFLMLSRKWQAPWPYLALATYYSITQTQNQILAYLSQAEKETYDFEKNIINDIYLKKGDVLFLQKKYEESLFYALKVYDFSKEKALSFLDPGEIYLAWKKNEQAEEFWKKASQDHSIKEELKEHLLQKLKVLENIKEK